MKLLYLLVITCCLIASGLALPTSSVVFYRDDLGQYSYGYVTRNLSKSDETRKDGETVFAYSYGNEKYIPTAIPVIIPVVKLIIPQVPENKNMTKNSTQILTMDSSVTQVVPTTEPTTEQSVFVSTSSDAKGIPITNDTKPEMDKTPQIINVINFHPLRAYSNYPTYVKYATRIVEQ